MSKIGSTSDGENIVLCSANGMSGGPIIALRLYENQYAASLFAIQTVEDPASNQIYGCYIKNLVDWFNGELPSLLGD